ncbi:lipocalin-like domain-containing protein [Actinoplanes sp. L3-i22]|uniref:lipocalin-like domain-containing protein n=1 Tax=Actinoplanes sp. L3-i22 TaxID=2836373 RepID=UPI001C7587F6|nr:lipocalin-like domain-containing protein [Actinoplanes sp. L3-i22]BCY13451.1 hypothetical protein L3i22_085390 [Actinoplanes sp. L3-i22]
MNPVGTWRLVSFDQADADGRTLAGPLGAQPRGLLIYTPEGHLSVSMMSTTAGQTPQFMGYAGRWRIDGAHLIHQIHVSSRPDWIGAEQIREPELDGERMTIRTTQVVDGQTRTRILCWERASPHHFA